MGHFLYISPFQSTLPVWGGTRHFQSQGIRMGKFQSTLPVWGGTGLSCTWIPPVLLYFNPPSPCGEGLSSMADFTSRESISIHPPRVGRDGQKLINPAQLPLFQSTLPVWGGTLSPAVPALSWGHFNPPSPCGEGHDKAAISIGHIEFQSTLPVWGGTNP